MFLQEVAMVVVLTDLKLLLCNYVVGMQNAMVEDFTYTVLNREKKNIKEVDAGESMNYNE